MPLQEKFLIPSSQGFDPVYRKPDLRFNSGNFRILARQNEVDLPRLGVSIKKRDYKLAVERNRLKRRIKNSFRVNLNRLPGYDFVVMVNAGERLTNKNKLDALWEGCRKKIL
ncbi:MAG: ribonuclease P protein component [Gammaproteobacteria bacterium]|nr:ribonuclease P protein component [Gammaproteobacteria bacterium]|tara:strand:+ start:46 stop:381 length:336 start_codon:yes stop_codon:yes gene_type:complete